MLGGPATFEAALVGLVGPADRGIRQASFHRYSIGFRIARNREYCNRAVRRIGKPAFGGFAHAAIKFASSHACRERKVETIYLASSKELCEPVKRSLGFS
ncbi:MAG: hypothetical protein Kow0020_14960 [Wenzhouxiangellaceae bacterium]